MSSKTISSKFNIKYVITGIIILILSMINSSIMFESSAAIISPDVLYSSQWYCTHEGGKFHNFYPATYKRKVWKSYPYSYTTSDGIVHSGTRRRRETESKYVSSAKVKNYYTERSTKTVSSLYEKSQSERIEAYVLGSDMGQGYTSSAQQWVWGHGGAEKAYQYIKDTALGFINDAGSDAISYNDKIGPFKINYDDINNENAYSRLTKLVINYMDGSSVDSNIEIMQEGVEGGKPFTDVSKIKKNKEFYVINPNLEKEVKEIELTLNKRYVVYGATETDYVGKEALAEKLADGWKCTDVLYTPQDLMYVVKKTPYWEEQEEIKRTFKINTKRGDIELTKKGIYNDQEENLSNMTFKVYCNTVNKFIKDVTLWPNLSYERYEISFTDNIEEAKSYTTGENGIVLIQHLYAGRVNSNGEKEGYTYTLVEYDGGENSYYIDPLKIESAESSYQLEGKETAQDNGITTGHMTVGDKKYCTVENITIFYDDNVNKRLEKISILIKDDRTSGDLTVEKRDETFPDDVKLQGARFKINLVRSAHLNKNGEEDSEHDLNANGWLKINDNVNVFIDNEDGGTRVYDFSKVLHDDYLVNDKNDATEFETGVNGKFKILCVINGEYEIYETKTSEGYRIQSQWEYEDNNKWVYYQKDDEKVNISTEDNHIVRELANRKIVKLEGNIWEDIMIGEKDPGEYFGWFEDLAYDGEHHDKKLDEEVTVNLWIKEKDSSGNKTGLYGIDQNGVRVPNAVTTMDLETGKWSIYRKGQKPGEKYTEDDEGNWFKDGQKISASTDDIYYWDLTDAYIEFVYNNEKYICVDPFGMIKDQEYSVPRTSKAIENDLSQAELDDRNLGLADNKLPGSAITKQDAILINGKEMSPNEILDFNWKTKNGNEYKYKLEELGLTGYYNPGNYTVENINLGLWRKEQPEYTIQQTLEYSKIIMNNNIYTYNYTYRNDEGEEFVTGLVPTTNTQTGKTTYGAKVYPSDIAYTQEHDGTGMEMYVVYRIDIRNPMQKNLTYNRNIYEESRLYVTELINDYDPSKYEISTVNHEKDAKNWEGSEYFGLWDQAYNGNQNEKGLKGASYRIKEDGDIESPIENVKSDKLSDGIEPSTMESVYIQFKVKQDFLETMLANAKELNTFGLENEAVSQVHSIAHHAYTREDNVWNWNKEENHYDNNEENSAKGNDNAPRDIKETNDRETNRENDLSTKAEDERQRKSHRHTFLHRTIDYPKSAGELGLIFALGDERTISGTVYEDEDERENENVGNGIIDDKEANRAEGVKVELLLTGDSVATLYQKVKDNGGYDKKDAIVESTGANGTYSFVGVTPGLYRIRFTYPDGSTVMKEANNKETPITANDYKSTILNTDKAGDIIKNAEETNMDDMINEVNAYYTSIKGKNYGESLSDAQKLQQQKVEWYKHLYFEDKETKYNLATDDFAKRSEFSKYVYNTDFSNNETTVTKPKNENENEVVGLSEAFNSMESYTPYFNISVENDILDERKVEGEMADVQNKVEGRDTSTTKHEVKDNIYYGNRALYDRFNLGLIKTTETKLTIDKIISDVKLTTSSGTTLVQGDPREALSYVTALDNLSQGSKYVRVEMPLENIYGTALETTYKITIENHSDKDYVNIDYFRYGKNGTDLVKTTLVKVIDKLDPDYDLLNDTLIEKVYYADEREAEGTVNVVATEDSLELTDWSIGIETGTSAQTEYRASGIFRDDMDLTYDNAARITAIKLDAPQTLRSDFKWPERVETRLVVTPDTGEDRSSTYYVVGIISLIVLAAGIVVIKSILPKKED